VYHKKKETKTMNEFQPIKIPHLTTASSGPIMALEKHILDNQLIIEAWLRDQWQLTPPVFYSSADLRNAGFKVAPVDTNLFPAGFNNLNPEFLPLCIQAVQATMEKICPSLSKILVIAESHTRNLYYYESLASLQDILLKAGFEVEIGSLLPDLHSATNIELASGRKIKISPLKREANRIGVEDFSPCLILLNNDLSEGIPDILRNLEQKIMPPVELGWSMRLKSQHFHHYQEVSKALANRIHMDPWLITPLYRNCDEVNFMTREGEACLIENTQALLKEIQQKYTEYKVEYPPFVVIKADAGTYGMAVMTIKSADELTRLNRKQRVQMSKSKGNQPVSKVIIQEGIYTFETWGKENAVAEPVVYMIGRHVVGGFYRVHANRAINENLNAPGMNFEPLAFADSCNNPCKDEARKENRFYIYGVIARLAALAAAHEMTA
jgi:glutamate--cysteine ligase